MCNRLAQIHKSPLHAEETSTLYRPKITLSKYLYYHKMISSEGMSASLQQQRAFCRALPPCIYPPTVFRSRLHWNPCYDAVPAKIQWFFQHLLKKELVVAVNYFNVTYWFSEVKLAFSLIDKNAFFLYNCLCYIPLRLNRLRIKLNKTKTD